MRTLLRIGVVLLVLGMFIGVRKSLSEAKAPAAPKNRVVLINLSQVLKGYAKSARFEMENTKALVHLQNEGKKLQTVVEADTKELENKDLPDERRTELEKEITQARRRLEDLANPQKNGAAKKAEKHMVLVYKEVLEAANRYGRQHDLDLVLHYNDLPSDLPDFNKPANIARKIQAGALIPLYIREGLDVTDELIALLNDAYRAETKPDEKDKP